MSFTQSSAIFCTSPRVRNPNGCGTTAMGSRAKPSFAAWARPIPTNAVEQIVNAALPRRAISTLSWTLHDVQEPQSPEPAITRSHSRANWSSTSAAAGTDAARLR